MSKKYLAFLMIPLLLICCKQNNAEGQEGGKDPEVVDDPLEGEAFAKAATRLYSGETYLANSEITEKYMAEISYPDNDLSFTNIFNYKGYGYDGQTYKWKQLSGDNYTYEPKPWPDGDLPSSYSIRWVGDTQYGKINLHLADNKGWAADTEVKAGSSYVNITNLIPNAEYTYKATAADGTVLAEGNFKTKGSLHQVYFTSNCRNARDLGGWKGLDGKTIKFRKVYRGGRMNDPWETMLNAAGKKAVLAEGIGAELELRGSDDYMTVAAVDGLEHCHPCIEEGGKVMLGVTAPSKKNCAKWLVFDKSSPWPDDKKAPYLKADGRIDKDKLGEITPTADEYAAFQEAYKAKTRECFEFIANNVHAGKGVYFHCSLGRDRTGTMSVITMGILGVPEGDISKEYELTYFAPMGFSVSSSDWQSENYNVGGYVKFCNTRTQWVYKDIVPYFWSLSTDGTFVSGIYKYLVDVAGVSPALIAQFREDMLE